MSLKSLLKSIGKALPVIVAHAPAVIGAVSEVAKAVKKPKAAGTAAAPQRPAA